MFLVWACYVLLHDDKLLVELVLFWLFLLLFLAIENKVWLSICACVCLIAALLVSILKL